MCNHSRLIIDSEFEIRCEPCGKLWAGELTTDLEGRLSNAYQEIS